MPDTMLVAGHRGARRIRPENTMTAFRYAMEVGVDMIETDIRQTKDGYLVLMHDAKVDRTTDGTGLVRDFTLKEFRALNAAAHDEGFAKEAPPMLEELLELVAGHPTMTINLELKEYPHVEGAEFAHDTAEKTLAMAEKYGLGKRIWVNSWSGEMLRWVCDTYEHRYPLHGYYPYFYLGDNAGDPTQYLDVACLFHAEKVDGKIRSLPGQVCPQSWFDDLASHGIEPWVGAGVKTFEDLEACAQRGAKLITTDDPAQTLADLRRMGRHP